MSTRDSKVDAFIARADRWPEEISKLREILLACGLEESIKWGKPCFAAQGKNIAIIQPFKAHCALLFFKGALLEDERGLLRSQGENSHSAKRLEFTSPTQIKKTVLADYVKRAIALEESGQKPEPAAPRELQLPDELARALKADKQLAKAFQALTPGRQRSYVLHIAGAKQAATRATRVERCTPGILAGKGFNER
jgi:uncharacterized protein YdeI (YjbR/CyaY-like superfamily)